MWSLRTSLSVAGLGVCVSLLHAAPAALAADGVLEINQACASQTGCFAGDTPGFPVTITAAAPAKSFRLTSDLVMATVGLTAISIQTDLVRVDLGGFTVRGPVACAGTPLVCTPAGGGDGVAVSSTARQAVEVRNGAVSGMGQAGISLGIAGVVENVRATHNGLRGILIGAGGAVRGSNASFNGAQGIVAGAGGHVVDSVAEQNGSDGINANSASVVLIGNTARGNGVTGMLCGSTGLVKDNSSASNGFRGISGGSGSTISDNSVAQNLDHGIACSSHCTVSGNTVGLNGNAVTDDAIQCTSGCNVRGNTVLTSSGTGAALNLGATSMYRENLVDAGGSASVSGGVNRGDNFCTGTAAVSPSCP